MCTLSHVIPVPGRWRQKNREIFQGQPELMQHLVSKTNSYPFGNIEISAFWIQLPCFLVLYPEFVFTESKELKKEEITSADTLISLMLVLSGSLGRVFPADGFLIAKFCH